MGFGTAVISTLTTLGVSIGLQAGGVDQPASPSSWMWPLDPRPAVVHAFEPPERRWEPGHRGVDLAASVGQAVVSPAAGEVAFAGVVAGRGVVVVKHANGLRSTFEPVDGAPAVGDQVGRGEAVGRVAAARTHCEPAVCVHWGVLRGRDYLDPLTFINRPPIVLLPLG